MPTGMRNLVNHVARLPGEFSERCPKAMELMLKQLAQQSLISHLQNTQTDTYVSNYNNFTQDWQNYLLINVCFIFLKDPTTQPQAQESSESAWYSNMHIKL